MARGRPNRSGIDWGDPAAKKARLRENTRAWTARGRKKKRGPITIDGVEYPTQTAAAKALGITPAAIWNRLHTADRRAYRAEYRKRLAVLPRGVTQRRWVRLSKDDMALVLRLLPHFPKVATIDDLLSHALHRLAETTDD